MPNYKHKETGEIKHFSKIRTYYPEKGEPYSVNLDDTSIDMTEYDLFQDEPTTSYETVRMSKSSSDGRGIR